MTRQSTQQIIISSQRVENMEKSDNSYSAQHSQKRSSRQRGKELTIYHIIKIFNPLPNDKFQTLPNCKSLLTTISTLMKMAESSSNR